MALSDATLLGLERFGGGFELPEDAAVGISMTMQPIEAAAQIERDVNGNLIDLMEGFDQFRKYEGSISCDHLDSPGFALATSEADAVWPGDKFTLTCLPQLGADEPIVLVVLCKKWTVSRDEWGAATSWSFDWGQV